MCSKRDTLLDHGLFKCKPPKKKKKAVRFIPDSRINCKPQTTGLQVDLIQIVFVDSMFYALDNRRLAVYRILEMEGKCSRIKAILASEPENMRHKFTTKLRLAQYDFLGGLFWVENCLGHTPNPKPMNYASRSPDP